jgi:hypothetical protein
LSLRMSRTARSRVTHYPISHDSAMLSIPRLTVSYTHPALETSDGRPVKHIPDHTIRLDLVEPSALPTGHTASCILTADSSGLPLDHELGGTNRCWSSERPSALESQLLILGLTKDHRSGRTSRIQPELSESRGGRGGEHRGHRTLLCKLFSPDFLSRKRTLKGTAERAFC